MKKILIPTDFSPSSYKACEYAALLAKELGVAIYLLHVYRESVPTVEGPVPWNFPVMELQKQSEKSINKEIEFLEEKYSIEVGGDVREGFTGDSINDVAKEIGADLIVMGIQTVKRNRILGSTCLKVIRKSKIPVLIVPESVPFKPIKNIVLAIDFKEMAEGNCFNPLFEIVKKFDASLQVIHVEKKGADLKASEVAEKLQLGLVLSKVSFLYDKIENDNVDQGISDFVESHPADLLVMVAHHHDIFERIFGHVHTRSVRFEIKLPLLVLKNK